MAYVKTHIIDSGSNGFDMRYPRKGEVDKLMITHNAGFFSCSTIALQDIVIYHRQNKKLPDIIDRGFQYSNYKSNPSATLIPHFFKEADFDIPFTDYYEISHDNSELQFSDYKKLDFERAKPFIDKFFQPSDKVMEYVAMYEQKYKIDYENTIGVFYRGNDKNRETKIAPYSEFTDKAEQVYTDMYLPFGDNYRFFVLPDEFEFLEAMYALSKNVITPDELPICQNKDSAMFFELPYEQRADYAQRFFAAVIVMSKCKHMITHSGNCGLWATLYRGNSDNLHQWLNDKWI